MLVSPPTMNYASALVKGKQYVSKPAPAPIAPPPVYTKPEESPETEDVDESVQGVVDDEIAQNDPSLDLYNVSQDSYDAKENVGRFGLIEFDDDVQNDMWWNFFIICAGQSGVCNLALTCRYLFGKLLKSEEIWDLVSSQEPATSVPVIKSFIDISPVDTNDEENEKVEEKVQTVPLSQVRTESQKIQLLKFWLRSVSRAYAIREKKIADAKQDDPTSSSVKPTLEVVLHGGFTIEVGEKKNAQQIVVMRDLSKVWSWLEAVSKLLEGKVKTHTLPYQNGKAVLARVGRGGTMLSLTVTQGNESNNALFKFDDFCLAIRDAAKEFIPFAGSCRVGLIKLRKTVDKNDVTSYNEKETYIIKVLAHDELNKVIQTIKKQLETGAIPRSHLPNVFRNKHQVKQKRKEQESIENEDIMDFILDNLPLHWEETKKAASRLSEYAKIQRESEIADFQARKEALKQERLRLKSQLTQKTQEDSWGAAASWNIPSFDDDKKAKKKKEKIVDGDGFISYQTVGEDGKPEEPDPKAVAKAEKEKTKKAKKAAPPRNDKDLMIADNPYAPVLKEHFETLNDAQQNKKTKTDQPKTNAKKAEPVKQSKTSPKVEKTSTKTESKKSPQEKSKTETKPTEKKPKITSQEKSPRQQKTKSKSNDQEAVSPEPKKPKQKSRSKTAPTKQLSLLSQEWVQPVVAVISLIVFVALGYSLVLS